MPELPEVETISKDLIINGLLKNRLINLSIFSNHLNNHNYLTLCNKRLHKISRRGKYLILSFDKGLHLIIHFRMSGKLLICSSNQPIQKHEHALLEFSNGLHIRFHDPRKFGRWSLTHDLTLFFHKLGPEPFDLTSQSFFKLLQRPRALKPLLLDQNIIAGLGNIYVDESLWKAQLHPLTLANTLTFKDCDRLLRAIIESLKKGIEAGGTTIGQGLSNFKRMSGYFGKNQYQLNVYQQTGNPCLHCGTKIIKIKVAQRGTHLCPICQKIDK